MNDGINRILLICSDDRTAGRLQGLLEDFDHLAFSRKSSFREGLATLREDRHDSVVLATAEGEKGWVQGIAGLSETLGRTPVIAFVPEGTGRDEDAYEAGAFAYIEDDDFAPRALGLTLRQARNTASACRRQAHSDDIMAMTRKLARIGQWQHDFGSGEGVWSPECLSMFGMEDMAAEEARLETFLDRILPEDLPAVEELLDKTRHQCVMLDVEFRIRRHGERHGHIRCMAEPIRREDGACTRLMGLFQDVTRQRQVDAELERRRTQMLDAQSIARMGSWDMDENGDFLWSEGLFHVFGCKPDEIHSFKSFRQYIHPEDREVFDQANLATFQEGWPVDFEYRIIRPDGELRHLHLHRRVKLDNAGKVARAYGIARDITPQKRFELALGKRDAILQAVSQAAGRFLGGAGWVEETSQVIASLGLAMDAELAFVYCNEMVGGELTAALTHDWHAPDQPSLRDNEQVQQHSYSKGYTRWKERMEARKSIMGHTRTLPESEAGLLEALGVKSILVVPVFVDEQWWGFIGTAAYKTEREWLSTEVESLQVAAEILGNAIHRDRMEHKLVVANRSAEEAQKEAEEANKAKSMFLANMSHEIRTPISGIIGLTEMTITTGLKPEQRSNLNMIRDAARFLLNLVNDILDISKIEANKLTLLPADFDLHAAVERMVRPFTPQLEKKGLTLETDIDDNVPRFLHGDRDRLAQIVRNLLSNAIKFTDEGHIDLHVETDRTLDNRVCLAFRVADTGIGIPPDMLDEIFEIFTQVDISAHKRHQGTGLGLAICKELVSMMGGDIDVTSRLGRGSVFTFRVWFETAEAAPDEDEYETKGLPALLNLSILLVEDNELNQKFLTHFLSMFGHTVTLATNGREALDTLKQARDSFDLILMDIQMPEMGGIEATRRIRDSKGRRFDKDIPIIALTAYAMKGDRDQMLEAGMDDYVSKPVDMEELSAAIVRTVNKKRRRQGKQGKGLTPRSQLVQPAQGPGTGFRLNEQALIERFKGNDMLLKEILDIFLREAEDKMERINEAWSRQEATDLGKALHSVANIVSHVHALEIMGEARQLEQWVLQGRMDLAGSGLPGLRQRFRQVIEAVRNYRGELE